MHETPEAVVEFARQCDLDNPDSIEDAMAQWMAGIDSLGGEDYKSALYYTAGQQMIYRQRNERNVRIRKDAGVYGGPAKVRPSLSTASTVIESYFSYAIDGRPLGDIRWEELNEIAKNQEALAEGHQFNAQLCLALLDAKPQKAKDDQTLKESVSERTIKSVFKSLGK